MVYDRPAEVLVASVQSSSYSSLFLFLYCRLVCAAVPATEEAGFTLPLSTATVIVSPGGNAGNAGAAAGSVEQPLSPCASNVQEVFGVGLLTAVHHRVVHGRKLTSPLTGR